MRLGNILMILAAILLVVSKEILAGGVKTNINEVTDLFEKKIENQQQLEGDINE